MLPGNLAAVVGPVANAKGLATAVWGTCLALSTGVQDPSEDVMCEVPVFYATTEGQTRRIADYLAMTLCDLGLASAAIDVRTLL